MKRLNNKGYMLVEVIVASVIAIGIGYYLIELVFNFSNKNDDEYQLMSMLSDKTVITKSIMNDLEGKVVSDIVVDNDDSDGVIKLEFSADDGDEATDDFRRLIIDRNAKKIEYGLHKDGNFVIDDMSYYYKKLDDNVMVGDINVVKKDLVVNITIPMSTIYDDGYDIKLSVTGAPIAVMMERDDSVAFWQESDRIVSIKFKSNIVVPSTVSDYWDISHENSKGKVIAYVEPVENNGWYYNLTIGGEGGVYASSGKNLFSNMSMLSSIEFNNSFDTSNVTDMSYMFSFAWNNSLTSLDLSGFDTKKVTNMSHMFNGLSGLSSLDLSGFDTSSVTDMSYMFNNSWNGNFTSLEIDSSFDTSNVTNMDFMFNGLPNLVLDCSKWNVDNVVSHESFSYSLGSITEPNWVN